MVRVVGSADNIHMWKRDDSKQTGLQDAVNRSREEIRRSVPEGAEPPLPVDFGAPQGPEPLSRAEVEAPQAAGAAIRERDLAAKPIVAARGLHPFLQGLLEIVPEPGLPWPLAKREQWLEAARNIFALLYDEPSEQHSPLRVLDAQTTSAAPDANSDPGVDRYSA